MLNQKQQMVLVDNNPMGKWTRLGGENSELYRGDNGKMYKITRGGFQSNLLEVLDKVKQIPVLKGYVNHSRLVASDSFDVCMGGQNRNISANEHEKGGGYMAVLVEDEFVDDPIPANPLAWQSLTSDVVGCLWQTTFLLMRHHFTLLDAKPSNFSQSGVVVDYKSLMRLDQHLERIREDVRWLPKEGYDVSVTCKIGPYRRSQLQLMHTSLRYLVAQKDFKDYKIKRLSEYLSLEDGMDSFFKAIAIAWIDRMPSERLQAACGQSQADRLHAAWCAYTFIHIVDELVPVVKEAMEQAWVRCNPSIAWSEAFKATVSEEAMVAFTKALEEPVNQIKERFSNHCLGVPVDPNLLKAAKGFLANAKNTESDLMMEAVNALQEGHLTPSINQTLQQHLATRRRQDKVSAFALAAAKCMARSFVFDSGSAPYIAQQYLLKANRRSSAHTVLEAVRLCEHCDLQRLDLRAISQRSRLAKQLQTFFLQQTQPLLSVDQVASLLQGQKRLSRFACTCVQSWAQDLEVPQSLQAIQDYLLDRKLSGKLDVETTQQAMHLLSMGNASQVDFAAIKPGIGFASILINVLDQNSFGIELSQVRTLLLRKGKKLTRLQAAVVRSWAKTHDIEACSKVRAGMLVSQVTPFIHHAVLSADRMPSAFHSRTVVDHRHAQRLSHGTKVGDGKFKLDSGKR